MEKPFRYHSDAPSHTADYLWADVLDILKSLNIDEARCFELGCGNGAFAEQLETAGFVVTGVDSSSSGIELARDRLGSDRFHARSVYDDLATEFGRFPLVVSLEVIEHLVSPASFLSSVSSLLEDQGYLVISTPYHGYLKNLALALTNRFDFHWSPAWEGGHIKFWSVRTLTALLESNGFEVLSVRRVGRIPVLAKSMIMLAQKRAVGS